jgi:hypothetical protein
MPISQVGKHTNLNKYIKKAILLNPRNTDVIYVCNETCAFGSTAIGFCIERNNDESPTTANANDPIH